MRRGSPLKASINQSPIMASLDDEIILSGYGSINKLFYQNDTSDILCGLKRAVYDESFGRLPYSVHGGATGHCPDLNLA